jgi:predicted acyl esterase
VRHVPRALPKVGVLGISYPGWLAAMAGVNPHPAVKAISPQAPMTDTWMGDDFFHYGAFRLSYGFEYGSEMELSKDESLPPPVGGYDTYDWYLAKGPLGNLTRLLAARSPSWSNFAAHPAYDAFWRARALPTYLRRLAVPTLTVGGWWDQEDFYGPLTTYATLEGHRIMVQVQSTWFPLYDRNPQTFVPNIFAARPADFRPATQRVYRSARHPSHVTIPVLTE